LAHGILPGRQNTIIGVWNRSCYLIEALPCNLPVPQNISAAIDDDNGMKVSVSLIVLFLAAVIVAGCTGTGQPAQQTTVTTVNTFVTAPTSPPATPISQVSVSANTVTIKDFAFTPQTITVKAGAIVRWENLDSVSHRVVFTDPTGNIIKYDSSVLSPSQSWSQTFLSPGIYPYYCKIHPQMTGTVIVE